MDDEQDDGLTLEAIERMLAAREVSMTRRRAIEHERAFREVVESAKSGKLPDNIAAEALALDRRKKLKVTDKAGNVLREVTPGEYAVDVDRALDVRYGTIDGAVQQTVCAGWPKKCPKQAKPSKYAFRSDVVSLRGGRPWLCGGCSSLRARSMQTPEQRSLAAKKAAAKRLASMTEEQKHEAAKRVRAATTPEQRRLVARIANAALTTQQRIESAQKAWATRRAKAKREEAA